VVSVSQFRSEVHLFESWYPCCFLRQETLPLSLSSDPGVQIGTSDPPGYPTINYHPFQGGEGDTPIRMILLNR